MLSITIAFVCIATFISPYITQTILVISWLQALPAHVDPNDENVNKAAAKIQALVRGHKARREVKALKLRASHAQFGIDPDNPRVHMAASKIQALVRGHKARRRVRELQNLQPRENRRGNHANWHINNKKMRRANIGRPAHQSHNTHAMAQGTHQRNVTGTHSGPQEVHVHVAATKIQAWVRGHQTRKEIKVLKVKKKVPSIEPGTLLVEKPEAHEAATKIQAIVRGRKARKDVKVLKVKHKAKGQKIASDIRAKVFFLCMVSVQQMATDEFGKKLHEFISLDDDR